MSAQPRSYPVVEIRSARFRSIIAMAFIIMAGFGLIIPVLPQFVKELGQGEAGVATVVFAFALTRLIGDFFTAPLLERIGERTTTAVGAAIVGISSIAAGFSRTFLQLIVLRGLGGFGSAFFLGGLMAYIINTTPMRERGRAMGIFQASFGFGFLIGPAIGGGMLAFTTPRMPFYAYGVVCIACVPLIMRAITAPGHARVALEENVAETAEEPLPGPRLTALRHLGPLLRDSAYRAAISSSALQYILSSIELTLIPKFWTDVLHQGKGTSGIPFVVSSIAGLAVIYHAGVLSDRRGRKFALLPALAVSGIAVTAVGFTVNAPLVLVLWAMFGASLGYIRPGPSAIVGDISDAATRSIAVAGYRFSADLGAVVGPLMAGFLAQYVSYRAAFISGGVCAVLTLLVTLAARETLPARERA